MPACNSCNAYRDRSSSRRPKSGRNRNVRRSGAALSDDHDLDAERRNLGGELFGIESAVHRIAGRRMRRFEIQPRVRGQTSAGTAQRNAGRRRATK